MRDHPSHLRTYSVDQDLVRYLFIAHRRAPLGHEALGAMGKIACRRFHRIIEVAGDTDELVAHEGPAASAAVGIEQIHRGRTEEGCTGHWKKPGTSYRV